MILVLILVLTDLCLALCSYLSLYFFVDVIIHIIYIISHIIVDKPTTVQQGGVGLGSRVRKTNAGQGQVTSKTDEE